MAPQASGSSPYVWFGCSGAGLTPQGGHCLGTEGLEICKEKPQSERGCVSRKCIPGRNAFQGEMHPREKCIPGRNASQGEMYPREKCISGRSKAVSSWLSPSRGLPGLPLFSALSKCQQRTRVLSASDSSEFLTQTRNGEDRM